MSSRRVTRSSVRACKEKKAEVEGNPKTRLAKCSPVSKCQPDDVYEFEVDPNEPKAFKKKRQYNRKPKTTVTRAKKKVTAAPPPPPPTITTRSSRRKPAEKQIQMQETHTVVQQKVPQQKMLTKSTNEQQKSPLPESSNTEEVPAASTSTHSALQEPEPGTFVTDNVNDDLDVPEISNEHCSGLFEDPPSPQCEFIASSLRTPGRNSTARDDKRPDQNYTPFPNDQFKAQSTPLKASLQTNKLQRIPFSPINRDFSVKRPAQPRVENFGKPARLDLADLKKICMAKETVQPKHGNKNASLLVDCAAEAEGINSPIKDSQEQCHLEPPPSPHVHFSRPARRSYSFRQKAQRQIFQDSASESEEEAEEEEPKKKGNITKKKKKAKDPQYEKWLNQMNNHFEDINNYTLMCD